MRKFTVYISVILLGLSLISFTGCKKQTGEVQDIQKEVKENEGNKKDKITKISLNEYISFTSSGNNENGGVSVDFDDEAFKVLPLSRTFLI